MKSVVLLGALDTKGLEVAYVKNQLERRGHRTIVIDDGVMGDPQTPADISRQEVARAGGKSLEALIEEGRRTSDRAQIIGVMAEGAARIVKDLHSRGEVAGILSLGGSMGTAMGVRAMRVLPVGVPKLMVSTHLYPQAIGDGDITIMLSPTDIMGLNPITERTLAWAASALSAMVQAPTPTKTRPLIGITAIGVVTPGAMRLQAHLRARGYDTVVFHGRVEAVDQFADGGLLDGIIEFSIVQLVRDVLTSDYAPATLEKIARAGVVRIPQLIVPGSADMLVLRVSMDQLPAKYRGRKIYQHGPFITAVRTSTEDMARIASVISNRVNLSSAPVAVVVPRGGFSEIDKEGRSFYEPGTDGVLASELRRGLVDPSTMVELAHHVNDEQFASQVATIFQHLMEMAKQRQR